MYFSFMSKGEHAEKWGPGDQFGGRPSAEVRHELGTVFNDYLDRLIGHSDGTAINVLVPEGELYKLHEFEYYHDQLFIQYPGGAVELRVNFPPSIGGDVDGFVFNSHFAGTTSTSRFGELNPTIIVVSDNTNVMEVASSETAPARFQKLEGQLGALLEQKIQLIESDGEEGRSFRLEQALGYMGEAAEAGSDGEGRATEPKGPYIPETAQELLMLSEGISRLRAEGESVGWPSEKPLYAKLEPEILDALEAQALEAGISVGEFVKGAIHDYLVGRGLLDPEDNE